MSNIPEAELSIDELLIRRLLGDQHSDLAVLDISEFANGWDNVMFRLGLDLVVRVPRRAAAAQLVLHEQTWLPKLASELPLAIPAPVRIGVPTDYYPWHWSVLPWLSGKAVGVDPFSNPSATADSLGAFLGALHQPTPDGPENPYRGQPLIERDEITRERLDTVRNDLPVAADAVERCWAAAVAAPVWDGPPVLIHGDLHPLNMLATDGQLSAIIDFGDITTGDPATDLMVSWYLFDDATSDRVRRAAESAVRPIDDATWLRARGWTISHALTILASSADSPTYRAVAHQGLRNALG